MLPLNETFFLSYKMMDRHLAGKSNGIAEVHSSPSKNTKNDASMRVLFDTVKGAPQSITFYQPETKTEMRYVITDFEKLEPKNADLMIQEMLIGVPVWKEKGGQEMGKGSQAIKKK